MKASEIKEWPNYIQPQEWPKGVLENMDAHLITTGVIPVRRKAGVAMWPSALYDAHIRQEGNSRHSIKNGTRLADATDMHTKTYTDLFKVFVAAQSFPQIGGIGLYFDTNTPMIHMDMRTTRLMWIRVNGEYIYAHKEPARFYKVLGEWA